MGETEADTSGDPAAIATPELPLHAGPAPVPASAAVPDPATLGFVLPQPGTVLSQPAPSLPVEAVPRPGAAQAGAAPPGSRQPAISGQPAIAAFAEAALAPSPALAEAAPDRGQAGPPGGEAASEAGLPTVPTAGGAPPAVAEAPDDAGPVAPSLHRQPSDGPKGQIVRGAPADAGTETRRAAGIGMAVAAPGPGAEATMDAPRAAPVRQAPIVAQMDGRSASPSALPAAGGPVQAAQAPTRVAAASASDAATMLWQGRMSGSAGEAATADAPPGSAAPAARAAQGGAVPVPATAPQPQTAATVPPPPSEPSAAATAAATADQPAARAAPAAIAAAAFPGVPSPAAQPAPRAPQEALAPPARSSEAIAERRAEPGAEPPGPAVEAPLPVTQPHSAPAEQPAFLAQASGPLHGIAPADPGPRGADLASPQPPHMAGIGPQLAEAVARFPDRPVELTLAPEELGRVRLTLTTSESGIVLAVTAERPETLDLMRRNIDQLARDFREIGYADLSFSFTQQDRRPQADPQALAPLGPVGGAPAAAAALPAPSAPAPRPAAPSGGLDLRI